MPLPLLLIPIVAPFAFGTIKSIFTTDLDIAILGAKASGKTTLINILQTGKVDTLSTATSFEEKVEQIDADWTKNNVLSKTKILINEKKGSLFKKALSKVTKSTLGINVFKRTGADVPGDESFRQTYENYIVGKDILLLLFDISRYFDPKWDSKDGGKREAQALFDFVYDRRDTLASNGKIILMATHKDLLNSKQFPNEEAILSAFRQTLKGKPYANLGHSCTPVNLTSTEILEQIRNICEERKNG